MPARARRKMLPRVDAMVPDMRGSELRHHHIRHWR
jgi:hypothetical protein